jgi:hypothetical protein
LLQDTTSQGMPAIKPWHNQLADLFMCLSLPSAAESPMTCWLRHMANRVRLVLPRRR